MTLTETKLPENQGKHNQIRWISTLRGFAALLVFISHLSIIPAPKDCLFIMGRIGVVCFFLMTGFLAIPSRRKRNRKQYAFNRFLRIYPIYWLLLILMFLIRYPLYSFKQLLLNITLFEEFLGSKTILGASWMLPIELILFATITIVGDAFFVNQQKSYKDNLHRGFIIMVIDMIFAIITGYIRYVSQKPFPTAVFLLIGASVLGIYYWYADGKIKDIIWIGAVFEIGFIVSIVLSYPTQILRYVVSYNMGFVVFIVFEKCVKHKTLLYTFFIRLGRIGYTFFLGAGIPWVLLQKVFDFTESWLTIALGCILKMICAIVLGIIITKFIEEPLLRWGKTIERKL